jgi:cation-transporting ATPase E
MLVRTSATSEQAGTTALITLMMIALWVLAIVARPYKWWKIGLITLMTTASFLLFLLPFTQRFFALDPTDSAHTTLAVTIAAIGMVLVEAIWWIQRRFTNLVPDAADPKG